MVLIGTIAVWVTGLIVRGAEPRSVGVRIAIMMLLVCFIVSFMLLVFLFVPVFVMEVFVGAFVGGGLLLLLAGLPGLLKRVGHA